MGKLEAYQKMEAGNEILREKLIKEMIGKYGTKHEPVIREMAEIHTKSRNNLYAGALEGAESGAKSTFWYGIFGGIALGVFFGMVLF